MKLITQTIAKAAPALRSTDGRGPGEVPVVAKFFTPWGSWTWWLTEYDPAERRAFGFVTSEMCPEGELGYFDVSELEEVEGPFGLGIERDIWFDPGDKTLADVMRGARN